MQGTRTVLTISVLGLLAACATADGSESSDYSNPSHKAGGRDAYAPEITKDAYVIEEWAKTVSQLEKSCAELGEHCEEAKAARAFLDSQ